MERIRQSHLLAHFPHRKTRGAKKKGRALHAEPCHPFAGGDRFESPEKPVDSGRTALADLRQIIHREEPVQSRLGVCLHLPQGKGLRTIGERATCSGHADFAEEEFGQRIQNIRPETSVLECLHNVRGQQREAILLPIKM